MKKLSSYLLLALLSTAVYMLPACKKVDDVVVPPLQAHFTNLESGSYFITGPNVVYKIPIGLTTVSNEPRTVNIEVSSPTGAVQGTHYNLNSTTKSLTIPAGKAVDTLIVSGVFAQYQAGRKDTLVVKIVESGSVKPTTYNNTFRLFMRGPCFQGEIATGLQALLGNYNNTREVFGTNAYGPYRTTIKSATMLTATTANVVIGNIYDDGWSDLTFTLDWTDLNNRKITLVQQNAGGNAGNTFGATYAGQPYAVRPVPAAAGGDVGTFDFCNQTLTLKMQVGIWNVGYSNNLYTVNMAR